MKLYLIRHGESEGNRKHIFTGQLDVPLTEKGREEAKSCHENLKGIVFDKVYSSDLARAVETQELAYPEKNVQRMSLLRELSVGKMLEGTPVEDALNTYKDLLKHWKEWNFSAYGGENYDAFRKRAEEFLDLVAKSGDNTVAAFCHCNFIYTVCDVVLGTHLIKNVLVCNNCGIFVFEYLDGKWKMLTANYTGNI